MQKSPLLLIFYWMKSVIEWQYSFVLHLLASPLLSFHFTNISDWTILPCHVESVTLIFVFTTLISSFSFVVCADVTRTTSYLCTSRYCIVQIQSIKLISYRQVLASKRFGEIVLMYNGLSLALVNRKAKSNENKWQWILSVLFPWISFCEWVV
jgi:hypothetical protein